MKKCYECQTPEELLDELTKDDPVAVVTPQQKKYSDAFIEMVGKRP